MNQMLTLSLLLSLPTLALAHPALTTHTDDSAAGIVCETIHEPVPVTDGVYVLEHYTRCWHDAPAARSRVETACDLLRDAYGPREGDRRCDELLMRMQPDRLR